MGTKSVRSRTCPSTTDSRPRKGTSKTSGHKFFPSLFCFAVGPPSDSARAHDSRRSGTCAPPVIAPLCPLSPPVNRRGTISRKGGHNFVKASLLFLTAAKNVGSFIGSFIGWVEGTDAADRGAKAAYPAEPRGGPTKESSQPATPTGALFVVASGTEASSPVVRSGRD